MGIADTDACFLFLADCADCKEGSSKRNAQTHPSIRVSVELWSGACLGHIVWCMDVDVLLGRLLGTEREMSRGYCDCDCPVASGPVSPETGILG